VSESKAHHLVGPIATPAYKAPQKLKIEVLRGWAYFCAGIVMVSRCLPAAFLWSWVRVPNVIERERGEGGRRCLI